MARRGRGDNTPTFDHAGYDALDHETARARIGMDLGLVPATHPDADLEHAMLPDRLSQAARVDREMADRGHLLSAIEPTPDDIEVARRRVAILIAQQADLYSAVRGCPADESDSVDYVMGGQGRTASDFALAALITLGLAGVAIGLIIRAIAGGAA